MSIPDKAVEAARVAYSEICRDQHGSTPQDRFRAALEAAEPHLREQVAEEIAVALDAVPGLVYPEDIFTPDGTTVDAQSARVMRFAYPAAANLAREIGGVKP